MIAYTAWDSLQTIAQQYDADLTLVPGEGIALAPYRKRPLVSASLRRLSPWLRAGLAVFQAASGKRS